MVAAFITTSFAPDRFRRGKPGCKTPLVFLIISLNAEYAGNVEEIRKLMLPAGWTGPPGAWEPFAIVQLNSEQKKVLRRGPL
jgi:hypothetical protein